MTSEDIALSGSPKRVYGTSRNFGNNTGGVKGILKNKTAINDSQIDITPIDKGAVLQNWMTGELTKYKENQDMAKILATKKHSQECVNVAVISQKEYASTSEIEELSNIKTQPTFSQHHMKTDKIISSNRENFSTA